jgi:hypothetical protein
MTETCFVIMPFGEKADATGRTVDFDDVYRLLLKDAIEGAAGVVSVRCDEIAKAGWIHAEMIKSIADSPLAIVDISTLNPNVFYELGVRHALKPSGTVLIRSKGTATPFNIEGFNCIDYDLTDQRSRSEFRDKVIRFLENAVASPGSRDSLVYEVLDDLRVVRGAAEDSGRYRVIPRTETYCYEVVAAPGKQVCVITGDLRDIRICDVWVNSENTNMQMSRFYDRSFSGLIRYLGASKSVAGGIVEDTIANALRDALAGADRVEKAAVIPTGPGELEHTNQVKLLLHVASVEGELGVGYRPIAGIQRCVGNALRVADSPQYADLQLNSVLFPVMGTGTGGGELREMVGPQIASAVQYLTSNPGSGISKVYFSAYSERILAGLREVVESMPSLRRQTES